MFGFRPWEWNQISKDCKVFSIVAMSLGMESFLAGDQNLGIMSDMRVRGKQG